MNNCSSLMLRVVWSDEAFQPADRYLRLKFTYHDICIILCISQTKRNCWVDSDLWRSLRHYSIFIPFTKTNILFSFHFIFLLIRHFLETQQRRHNNKMRSQEHSQQTETTRLLNLQSVNKNRYKNPKIHQTKRGNVRAVCSSFYYMLQISWT